MLDAAGWSLTVMHKQKALISSCRHRQPLMICFSRDARWARHCARSLLPLIYYFIDIASPLTSAPALLVAAFSGRDDLSPDDAINMPRAY